MATWLRLDQVIASLCNYDKCNVELFMLWLQGPKEREIKKDENIMDILEKMNDITRMDHDVEFCVPWNYSYKVVSDEEKRFNEMVRQKDVEIDNKFQSLEKVIEVKNREMISAVKSIIEQIGNVEKEGEIYIHAVEADDPALVKGRTEFFLSRKLKIGGQAINILVFIRLI